MWRSTEKEILNELSFHPAGVVDHYLWWCHWRSWASTGCLNFRMLWSAPRSADRVWCDDWGLDTGRLGGERSHNCSTRNLFLCYNLMKLCSMGTVLSPQQARLNNCCWSCDIITRMLEVWSSWNLRTDWALTNWWGTREFSGSRQPGYFHRELDSIIDVEHNLDRRLETISMNKNRELHTTIYI